MLDEVLKTLTVGRQAYHGKSFIGNHVHKMLKPEAIKKLCDCLVQVMDLNVDNEILDLAKLTSSRFKNLFSKYATCHNLFNSSMYFEDEDIISLKTAINDLLSCFRDSWPTESITPKLHMLEKHVVPFIEKCQYGIGKYGEQGGEGIHPEFNNLTRICCRMRSKTQRVESMTKGHGIRTHTLAKKLKPIIKWRKIGKSEQ